MEEATSNVQPKTSHKSSEFFKHKLDGGYGWLIVLASFLMQACSFGVVTGFGVYLQFYRSSEFPNNSASYYLALIGTLASTTIALVSLISGRLCDVWGVKRCTILGMFLIVISQLLASISYQVWHLILSQGLLFGLGGALIYVPANLIITQWFKKNQGLAVGVGAAGSGVGGFMFSILNAHLLEQLGFQLTLRINAIIIGTGLLSSILIIRSPPISTTEELIIPPPFTMKLIFNVKFLLFCLTMLSSGFSFLTPLFYLPSYATHNNLTSSQGGTLLAIIGITSAMGRILGGMVGDRLGHTNTFLINLLSCTSLPLIWLFAKDYETLMVFSILYGLPSGGFAGGFASVCTSLFGDYHIGTLMGIAYAPTGLGDLLGPSIVGYLLDTYTNYDLIIYYIMVLFGLASLFMLILRFIQSKTITSTGPMMMEIIIN